MKKYCWPLKATLTLAILFLVFANKTYANVIITSTRIIYPASEKEVTIRLENSGQQASLIQAWTDKGNEALTPDQADGPFLITPPISRIDPNKGQSLRLIYTRDTTLNDQESIYWLNILDVPPKPKDSENYIQVAFKTRIKIFLRPKGLLGDPIQAAKNITWKLISSDKKIILRGTNTSNYHVSFNEISATTIEDKYKGSGGMIAPKSQKDFEITDKPRNYKKPTSVTYTWINDYGANETITTPLLD